jgi:hypothetical protein
LLQIIAEDPKPSNELVASMIDTEMTLDQKIEESELKLFSGSAPIRSADMTADGLREKVVTDSEGRKRRKVVFEDEDDEVAMSPVSAFLKTGPRSPFVTQPRGPFLTSP